MTVKHLGFVLGAALLMGTACAHGGGNQTAQNQPAMNQPGAPSTGGTYGTANESVTREKDALMSQADGTQPGKIRDFTGDTLTVDSQTPGTPSTLTMKIDSSVPVFQGMQKVGTDTLTPGQDVRVFYKNPTDSTQPQAIAVEIVSPGSNSGGMQNNQGSTTNPGSQDNTGTMNNPGATGTGTTGGTGTMGGGSGTSTLDQSSGGSGGSPGSGSMDNSSGSSSGSGNSGSMNNSSGSSSGSSNSGTMDNSGSSTGSGTMDNSGSSGSSGSDGSTAPSDGD